MLGRIAVGALLGAAIGFERDRHGCQAGLSTHVLVGLASATFMVVSAQFSFFQNDGRPGRDRGPEPHRGLGGDGHRLPGRWFQTLGRSGIVVSDFDSEKPPGGKGITTVRFEVRVARELGIPAFIALLEGHPGVQGLKVHAPG
jgi:hypothetical protein